MTQWRSIQRTTQRLLDQPGNGNTFYVDAVDGDDDHGGRSWGPALATVQAAHDAASAGDTILVGPGDYDEALVITKDNLTIVGDGPRGSVSIVPDATNGIAITIDGTTAGGRVEEVSL